MIPRQVKVGLCVLLAITITPIALPDFQPPREWLEGCFQIAHELAVGLIMGFIARLVVYALEVAGEYISISIGLSMSAQIDPFTRNRSTPANTLLVALGTILFLATDSHLWCLLAFARSFEVLPPDLPLSRGVSMDLVIATSQLFLIALQISAPILAVAFVVNLCFATLGRAAPSLNVFILSFPVQILAGLFLFGMTLTLIAQYIINYYRAAPERMLEILR